MPGPGKMKKSSKKAQAPSPASAHALPPTLSTPTLSSPPQASHSITAADLLAILRYANSINHTISRLATSAVDTSTDTSTTICDTPGDSALAADVLIDDEETIALINWTHNIVGKETVQKILHYAFWKGRDEGHKLGYDEGYHEAAGYGIIDANDGWKQEIRRDTSLAWKRGKG